jgi:hypothetical protein
MATWYMGPTGIDQLTGGYGTSASTPWLTLKYSAAHMADNDTLLIAPAYYNMTGTTTYISVGSTPLDGCTFKSSTPSSPVTFDGVGMTAGYDAIGCAGDGNIFEDIYLTGAKGRGWAIGATDHNSIANIWRRCRAFLNYEDGWFIGRCPQTQLIDCVAYNNAVSGSTTHHNVYINGQEKDVGTHGNNCIIDNLLCYNTAGSGLANDLHINGDNNSIISGTIVRNSTFINRFGGACMDLMNAHDSRVYNNLFYGTHGDKWVRCLSDDGGAMNSEDNWIMNNTFVMSGSTGKTAIWFVYLDGANPNYARALNCVAFNNLIFSADTSKAILDTGAGNFVDTVSNKRLTYSSSLINDYFVDAANGDYHLKSTAPARDAGVATYHSVAAPTTDKDGHARPQ